MDLIELRSEKVRSIIGKMPALVIRSGITILSVVFILLLVGSYFFPYTEAIHLPVEIIQSGDSSYIAKIEIPIVMQSKIEPGLPVMVEIEGYSKNKYGQLSGCLEKIDPIPIIKEDHKYLITHVNLHDNLHLPGGKIMAYYPSMQGTATILLKKERLLYLIFGWMKR